LSKPKEKEENCGRRPGSLSGSKKAPVKLLA